MLIYSYGLVEWIPPAIYQSSCKIDVTYFPFDQQKCVMKFGSWTYNGDEVSLKLHNGNPWIDLSDYWKSGTWDIVEVPAFLNVYNGTRTGTKTETDISFHITIRRKTLFYTVNLILPTLLISFLCILVFYLPAEAGQFLARLRAVLTIDRLTGEKVTLGISILLSLVVFLLLVSKILPPTSLVLPLIAKYLLFTFLMNCISILATVVIINWNFRGPRTHKMPNWIRAVFLKYLPVLLLIRRPKRTRLRWMMDMPSLGVHYHPYSKTQQTVPDSFRRDLDCADSVPQPPTRHHPSCNINSGMKDSPDQRSEAGSSPKDDDSIDSLFLTPEAYRATEAIEFIAEHLRSEDEYIQVSVLCASDPASYQRCLSDRSGRTGSTWQWSSIGCSCISSSSSQRSEQLPFCWMHRISSSTLIRTKLSKCTKERLREADASRTALRLPSFRQLMHTVFCRFLCYTRFRRNQKQSKQRTYIP